MAAAGNGDLLAWQVQKLLQLLVIGPASVCGWTFQQISLHKRAKGAKKKALCNLQMSFHTGACSCQRSGL